MYQKNMFLAKSMVAVFLGAVLGYFIGNSLAADAEKGRTLTMDEYVDNFARYKADLESHTTKAGAFFAMVILSLGFFALYEFLALLLAKLITVALDRPFTDPSRGAMQ